MPSCAIEPLFITAMREAIASASSWSWVTMMKVMPTFCCSCDSSKRIASRSLASSADSGSSSSSTFGFFTSARASATRWRWPPDS